MEKSLQELRAEIDQLDDELLKTISKRLSIIKEIGKIKKITNTVPFDENRMSEVLQKWKKIAKSENISEEFIEKIYKVLHDYSIEIEKTIK